MNGGGVGGERGGVSGEANANLGENKIQSEEGEGQKIK